MHRSLSVVHHHEPWREREGLRWFCVRGCVLSCNPTPLNTRLGLEGVTQWETPHCTPAATAGENNKRRPTLIPHTECAQKRQNFDFVQKSVNLCICKWKKKKKSSPCTCLAQSTFQRVPSKKRQLMGNWPFVMSQRAQIHHRYTSTQAGENILSLLSFGWSAKNSWRGPTFHAHFIPMFSHFSSRHGTIFAEYMRGARRWGAAWFCIAYFPTSSSAICCVSVTARIPSSLNNLGNAFAPLISSPLPNLTAHSLPRSLATPPLSLPSAANVPTPLRHSQLASGHWALNVERIFLSLALSKWQEWDVEILFDGWRRKVVFWQKCCVQSSILKQTQLHCKKDFFRRRRFFFF